MRMWVAIALGIAVLTAAFVFAQRERGGDDVLAPAAAGATKGRDAVPDGGAPAGDSVDLTGSKNTASGTSTGAAGSPAVVPEPQTSPIRSVADAPTSIDPAQRDLARAEGNAQITATHAGSVEAAAASAGGGGVTAAAPAATGIPAEDMIVGNDPSSSVGPLPGEGVPQVPGPLPGEGEPQTYGPLPGENDPQVLGPLPGEGEPDLPPGPLPGEG